MHWQREAIMHATVDNLWSWMTDDVHSLVPADKKNLFIDTIRANISFPKEASEWARIFFTDEFELTDKKIKDEIEYAPDSYFERILDIYRKYSDNPNIFGRELPVPENRKKAAAFQLVRGALTNKIHGPELARLLTLIPKARIERRLEHAISLSKTKK
jgi:glutamyl-tRNA synthetase